jgi:hypothetical protein
MRTARTRAASELDMRVLACLVYNGGEITDAGGNAHNRLRKLLAASYKLDTVRTSVTRLEKIGLVVRDNRVRSERIRPRMIGPNQISVMPRACFGVYLAKERDELPDDLQFYIEELHNVVQERMIAAAQRAYKDGETKREVRGWGGGGGSPGSIGAAASPSPTTEREMKVQTLEKVDDHEEAVTYRHVREHIPAEVVEGAPTPIFEPADMDSAALIADALLEKVVAMLSAPPEVVEVQVPTEVSNAVVDGLKHEIANLQAMLKRRDENIGVLQNRVDVLGKENEELKRAVLNFRNRGGRLTQRIATLVSEDTREELRRMMPERPDQQHRRAPRPVQADQDRRNQK